jgi:hypothetical protein
VRITTWRSRADSCHTGSIHKNEYYELGGGYVAEVLSPTVSIPLAAIAEPARGGYHRYLGWTIARLPVPHDWSRAVGLLAPVAECARSGNEPANDDLDALVLAAYNVNHSAVEPLLEWTYVRKND